MIELIKIKNGLKKKEGSVGNVFLDQERQFTNSMFESGLSYQKEGENDIIVELDNNIIYLSLNDIKIDGLTFNTQNELIEYLFNYV
jgi:hypothetical protein